MDIGQHIVVYDEQTNEVLLSVDCSDINSGIVKKGVAYSVYDGTAPVFVENDGTVKIRHNACIAKVNIDK